MKTTTELVNTGTVDVREVVISETGLKLIRNDFLEQCPFCGSGSGPKGTSAFSFHHNGYKCFSCEQTGDSVKFIERYYRLSIAEAIQYFKSRYLGHNNSFEKLTAQNRIWKQRANNDNFDTMGEWMIHLYENNYESDNLTSYLLGSGIFDEKTIRSVLLAYHVRTSSGGCIFPYIDSQKRVRTLKMMKYEKDTGKRDKSTFPFYLHKQMMGEEFKYKRCFFGEHLLSLSDKVGIVESEKTALVCAMMMPERVFLATGGKMVLNVNSIIDLKGLIEKEIILFPDHDPPDKRGLTAFQQWEFIAGELKNKGYDISVDDTLEDGSYPFGYDFADLILDIRKKDVPEVRREDKSEPKPPKQRIEVKKEVLNVPDAKNLDRIDLDRIDLHMKAHEKMQRECESRQKRLDVIKEALGALHIPDEPIRMHPSVILNAEKFIDINILAVDKNIGNDISEPYLQRLEKFIEILEKYQ